MKKYTVYIEERMCRGTEVEAESMEEAEKKVKKMYENSEIILDSNDMNCAEMMSESEEEDEFGVKESTDWHQF